jgi:hypothetical protein
MSPYDYHRLYLKARFQTRLIMGRYRVSVMDHIVR